MIIKRQLWKIFLSVFVLVTFFYAIFSWYRIVTTFAPDFNVYYGSARLLLQHKSIYGNTTLFTVFNYPPTTLLLFIPFALLPYQLAQGIWITLSFLLIPFISFLSLKIIRNKERISSFEVFIWSCLFFWSFPTKFTVGMGQINLVSLILLLMGSYTLLQKRKSQSVLWFTFLLISKPQFLLLLPFLFLAGYSEVAVGIGVLYLLITLVTGLIFGLSYISSYIQIQIPDFVKFSGREIYYNQSFSGFFSRIVPVDLAQKITQIASVITIIISGALVFLQKNKKGEERKKFILLLCLFLPAVILVEPLGWQHHLVFILPVILWLWNFDRKRLILMSYILISINIKQPQLFRGFIDTLFILSHGFWGILCIFVVSICLSFKKIVSKISK